MSDPEAQFRADQDEAEAEQQELDQWKRDIRWQKARLLHGFYNLTIDPRLSPEKRPQALRRHDLVADYLLRHPDIEVLYFKQDCDMRMWGREGRKGPRPPYEYGYYKILDLAEGEIELEFS